MKVSLSLSLSLLLLALLWTSCAAVDVESARRSMSRTQLAAQMRVWRAKREAMGFKTYSSRQFSLLAVKEPADNFEPAEKKKVFMSLLTRLYSVAQKHSVELWIDQGTALGAFRDGKIMPWDHDSDCGFWYKDHARLMAAKEEIEHGKRFSLQSPPNIEGPVNPHEDPKGFLRLVDNKTKLYTDIYHYKPKDGDDSKLMAVVQGNDKEIPKEYLHHTHPCKLEGHEFTCPGKGKKQLEAFLKIHYGNLAPDHKLVNGHYVPIEQASS